MRLSTVNMDRCFEGQEERKGGGIRQENGALFHVHSKT